MKKNITRFFLLQISFILCSGIFFQCVQAPRYRLDRIEPAGKKDAKGFTQEGYASYYGKKYHGRKTASGEVFDMYRTSAAHRSLPFFTKVRVTNLNNNKSIVVKINDRGPFVKGRIIDLSYEAAKKLDMIKDGVVKVKLKVVD